LEAGGRKKMEVAGGSCETETRGQGLKAIGFMIDQTRPSNENRPLWSPPEQQTNLGKTGGIVLSARQRGETGLRPRRISLARLGPGAGLPVGTRTYAEVFISAGPVARACSNRRGPVTFGFVPLEGGLVVPAGALGRSHFLERGFCPADRTARPLVQSGPPGLPARNPPLPNYSHQNARRRARGLIRRPPALADGPGRRRTRRAPPKALSIWRAGGLAFWYQPRAPPGPACQGGRNWTGPKAAAPAWVSRRLPGPQMAKWGGPQRPAGPDLFPSPKKKLGPVRNPPGAWAQAASQRAPRGPAVEIVPTNFGRQTRVGPPAARRAIICCFLGRPKQAEGLPHPGPVGPPPVAPKVQRSGPGV